jgi:hypothetical protein
MNKLTIKTALQSGKAVVVNDLWYYKGIYKYKIHNKATIYSTGFFNLDEAADAILEALKDKECVIEIK